MGEMIMEIYQSIILGVVEGITEFLPVSSTAHLALTSKLLGLAQSEFVKSYEIAIQSGAILAVVYLYWHKIYSNRDWLKKIIVAFIPTGIIGFLLYSIIKTWLLSSYVVMLWSLIIGGVLMIVFEIFHNKNHSDELDMNSIGYRECIYIGLFQSLAVIPGVSRAASTIIGGLLLGLNRKTIVEFSFLLAVPTMFLATIYDLSKTSWHFAGSEAINLLVGFFVSFLVAIFAIKFLLNFIRKNNFVPFGIYRIIIALLFLIFLL